MSFEGYWQHWCENGHTWETGYWYGMAPPGEYAVEGSPWSQREFDWDDRTCPECGQEDKAYNLVDDTNLDDNGKVTVEGRLPTLEELAQGAVSSFWHCEMINDSKWQQKDEDKPHQDAYWTWLANG